MNPYVLCFNESGMHYIGLSILNLGKNIWFLRSIQTMTALEANISLIVLIFPDINTTDSYDEMLKKLSEIEPYKAVLGMSRCNVWNDVTEEWDSSDCQVMLALQPEKKVESVKLNGVSTEEIVTIQ